MIASLAAATLCLGLAVANPTPSSVTEPGVLTIVPAIPILASSESHLEVPHATSDVPSTYTPEETPSSIPDYDTAAITPSTIAVSAITYPPNGPHLTSTTSSLGRIVHTERTQDSLAMYTTTRPIPPASPIALTSYATISYPTHGSPGGSSPIALTSYPSVVNPTLPPPISESPIALTSRTSVEGPTLPPTPVPSPIALTSRTSVAKPTYTSTFPAAISALTSYPSVAGPTLPDSETHGQTTYIPAIVHTEIPAVSLEVPPTQTISSKPSDETKISRPAVPVPGSDNGSGAQPAPSSVMSTKIQEQVTTMSGGEVVTMPGTTMPVESAPASGSTTTAVSTTMQTSATSTGSSETTQPIGGGQANGNAEEGAARKVDVELGSLLLLCMLLL